MEKHIIQPKPWCRVTTVFGIPTLVSVFFAGMYIVMQMHGIYGGDSGDLVTTAYLWGIPHPPGYPLYTFLSGLVIRLVPFGTIAWRACFLSSVPSALALFFLWRVCYRFTRSKLSSTIATVLYGLTGPVWLNAISQEVFGFYSLISIVFFDQLTQWLEEGKQKQLLFLAFWTGLALTHHHVILFSLAPACIFILWRRRDVLSQLFHLRWKIIFLVLLGCIPYIYAPIVSRAGTLFDTEYAASLQGFFRLVTRASYGTFQATAGGPPLFLNRLLNVYTFFQFILRDFSLIGLTYIAIGLVSLRRYHADLYDLVTISFASWIVFFFTAGFSQLLNYHIGTSERFFVVPYQLVALCIACGMQNKRKVIMAGGILLFAIAVFPRLESNYRAFQQLRTDRSMEQLAKDVALSAPVQSILFVSEDTTTYAMYYAYFVQKIRPDIKFIFFRWLGNPHYRALLRIHYPDLIVPEPKSVDRGLLLASFVDANNAKFPLASDTESNVLPGSWTSHGLLFLYKADTTLPVSHEEVLIKTLSLWNQFSPPIALRLFHKEIPMISDVLRVYAQHRAMVVREMALANRPYDDIAFELTLALDLEMNVVPEAYLYPIVILYEQNRCVDAKSLLSLFVKKWGYDRVILRQYYKWKLACGSDADVDPLAAFYIKRFPKDIQ